MKQFYQIHELAKLFDLCPDTLRYYEEKGLLHPVRGENRYRMYGIQDVCTLNIIRALRELGLPTRAIRAYLERRDRLPAEKAGAPPPGLSQNHRQPVYGGGGG